MSDSVPPSDWSVTEIVDVIAQVELIPTDEGGREQPLLGVHPYRPNHNFFGPENIVMCMGQLDIPAGDPKYPGDIFACDMRLILHPDIADTMQPGRRWRIQEGRKLVAYAEVKEVRSREKITS